MYKTPPGGEGGLLPAQGLNRQVDANYSTSTYSHFCFGVMPVYQIFWHCHCSNDLRVWVLLPPDLKKKKEERNAH